MTNPSFRRAKIVATIGPACQDEATIYQLLQVGVDVARLNFSHGSYDDHKLSFQRLRQASSSLNRPILILQDLQGPKIRVGELQNGEVLLKTNQPLRITTRQIVGDEQIIAVDYPAFLDCLQPGHRILLDDGKLELLVTKIEKDQVETQVVFGGWLKPHKGINLPGACLNIQVFTEKDYSDLVFGCNLGIDAVAVSFVRQAGDIEVIKKAIRQIAPENPNLPIIAKLERPEALVNLEEILEAADGVMVARGDLGVEMPPEEVPIAQKRIIEAANRKSKVVITATQMLDSMIHEPRPTRAEASDVANAILDGSDAVMLSGETASGKYPIQAVEMMHSIIVQAEEHLSRWGHWHGAVEAGSSDDDTFFMAQAARELAHDRNVSAIAVFTKSGRTALLLSKVRPAVPILAFTSDNKTYHRLSLYWGVKSYLVEHVHTIEEMLKAVENTILTTGAAQFGEQVVLICGFPISEIRPTNLALLHTLGKNY